MSYARYRQREVGEVIQSMDERWETPATNPALKEPAFVPVEYVPYSATRVKRGEIILQPITERNERYFAKHGYGCGPVLFHDAALPLRTLSVAQIDALVNMVLWGDVAEVPTDEDTLGRMAKSYDPNDIEGQTRMEVAAAIVYLSGHLAEDIPVLRRSNHDESA